MYRKNYAKIDQFRLEQHFEKAWARSLNRDKQLKFKNELVPFIPVTSKTEPGLDQIYAICSYDTPVQAGDVVEFKNKEWLILYEDTRIIEAYKKFVLQPVNEYVIIHQTPTPFVFIASLNYGSGLSTTSPLPGILFDSLTYRAMGIVPQTHYTEKIDTYYEFLYNNYQWRVNNVFANLLPNVVVFSIERVSKNDSVDIPPPIVDTEEETFDYIITVTGKTDILKDKTQIYTWKVVNKDTGLEEQIPLQANIEKPEIVEIISENVNQLQVKGTNYGDTKITLESIDKKIQHEFRVRVISLW